MTEAMRGYLTPFPDLEHGGRHLCCWPSARCAERCSWASRRLSAARPSPPGWPLPATVIDSLNLTTSLNGSPSMSTRKAMHGRRATTWRSAPMAATAIRPAPRSSRLLSACPATRLSGPRGQFSVGDHPYVGLAKTHAKNGEPLAAAEGGVIPPGEYFLATPNPDSLDSRYAEVGNVKELQIIGRAHELF